MRNFHIKRFGHLMTWTLREERSKWVSNAVAQCALFCFFLSFATWKAKDLPPQALSWKVGDVASLSMAICLAGCLMYMTQFLTHVKTKEQSIVHQTLPASTREKFLSRWLYVCVLLPLSLPVAFVGADLLTMVFAQVLGVDYVMEGCCQMGEKLRNVLLVLRGEPYPEVGCLLLTAWAMGSGFVLLCSIVFRRPLVMTAACLLVFGFMLVNLVEDSGMLHYFNTASNQQLETFAGLLALAFLLVALLELWLSYRVFRRMQVVTGRFTNL